jgi:hypothetical protein
MSATPKRLIYLSGKFSDSDLVHGIEANVLRASKVGLELWKNGWAVINPHKNTSGYQHVDEIGYNTWIEGDKLMVERCDAIFMLTGWEESKGATLEREHAIRHGIPIFYEKDGIPSPKCVEKRLLTPLELVRRTEAMNARTAKAIRIAKKSLVKPVKAEEKEKSFVEKLVQTAGIRS